MNVTQNVTECRKQIETYCQKDSAEHKEYDRGHNVMRITENKATNRYRQEEGILEKIITRDNLNLAYKKVKANKGAGGIDKMSTDELLGYLILHGEEMIETICKGK